MGRVSLPQSLWMRCCSGVLVAPRVGKETSPFSMGFLLELQLVFHQIPTFLHPFSWIPSPPFPLIPAAPTTPPLNVTVSFNESSSSLEIRWVKPSLERIHGELQGYHIRYRWHNSEGTVSHQGMGKNS